MCSHSSTESVGQIHDAGHALVTALGHDVGRAELARELLPRLVAAHRDDPLGTHLLGGEHAEQTGRTLPSRRTPQNSDTPVNSASLATSRSWKPGSDTSAAGLCRWR